MSNKNTSPASLPDLGRIQEFVDGVYGTNREANEKAYKRAAIILSAAVAYSMYKGSKRGKR